MSGTVYDEKLADGATTQMGISDGSSGSGMGFSISGSVDPKGIGPVSFSVAGHVDDQLGQEILHGIGSFVAGLGEAVDYGVTEFVSGVGSFIGGLMGDFGTMWHTLADADDAVGKVGAIQNIAFPTSWNSFHLG